MLETLTAIIFISAIVFVAMTGKRSDEEESDHSATTKNSPEAKK